MMSDQTMNELRALDNAALNRAVWERQGGTVRIVDGSYSLKSGKGNTYAVRDHKIEWDFAAAIPDVCGDLNLAWELGKDLYLSVAQLPSEKIVMGTVSHNVDSGDLPFYTEVDVDNPARAIVLAWLAMQTGEGDE